MTTANTQRSTRDIRVMLARGAWTQGLGLLRQFVIIPLLSPAQLALIKVIQQVASYATLADLGALLALKTRYPEWEAAGREADCRRLQGEAWFASVAGCFLFLPIFAWFGTSIIDSPLVLAGVSILAVTPLLGDYVAKSLVARGQFSVLARIELFASLIGFGILLGAALWGNTTAVLFAVMLGASLKLLWGFPLVSKLERVRGSLRELFATLRYGFGIWAASAVSTLATTGDLVVLAWFAGGATPVVGLYAAALMVSRALSQLVAAVALVQQRQLRQVIGRVGAVRNEEVHGEYTLCIGVDCLIAVVLSVVAFVPLRIGLPHILPSYAGSLLALGPLLMAVIPLRVSGYARAVLFQDSRLGPVIVGGITQGLILIGAIYVAHDLASALLWIAVGRCAALWVGTLIEVVPAEVRMGGARVALMGSLRLVGTHVPLTAAFLCTASGLPVVKQFLVLGAGLAATLGLYRWLYPGCGTRVLEITKLRRRKPA